MVELLKFLFSLAFDPLIERLKHLDQKAVWKKKWIGVPAASLGILVGIMALHPADIAAPLSPRVLVVDELEAELENFMAGSAFVFYGKVIEVAEEYNLDPELIFAIIEVESSWRPGAESHKGARGLMQVMPFNVPEGTNLFNPWVNVNYGCRHLSQLLKRFKDVEKALLAYNYGEYGAKRLIRLGVRPQRVTYVQRVLAARNRYQGVG